jgi:hypothetical protein
MFFQEVGEDMKHQFTSILHAKTHEHSIEVRAHRGDRYAEFFRDLLVGMTEEELLNDGCLPAGKRQVALDPQPFAAGKNRSFRCHFHPDHPWSLDAITLALYFQRKGLRRPSQRFFFTCEILTASDGVSIPSDPFQPEDP